VYFDTSTWTEDLDLIDRMETMGYVSQINIASGVYTVSDIFTKIITQRARWFSGSYQNHASRRLAAAIVISLAVFFTFYFSCSACAVCVGFARH